MTRKPKSEENISLGRKAPRPEEDRVYKSIKDGLQERLLLAQHEGVTMTRRHFNAVSLFPEGVAKKYVAIENYDE